MLIGVKILPRHEVLDSQGRALEDTLRHNGIGSGVSCRVGRYVQLEIEAASPSEARERAQKLAEFVLCNHLIETFEIEVL